jgi:hypothetical protein
MSWPRLRPPPEDPPPVEDVGVLDDGDDDEDPPDEPVEYFVEVLEESAVWTAVPKSVQSSQTSSSAPSILTRFGELVSVPHISH